MKPSRAEINALLGRRAKFLERRPVISIARSLGALSRRWLRKNDVFRKKALRRLVKESAFSEAMAVALIDALFGELTTAKLLRLLRSEFSDPRALDTFRPDAVTGHRHRAHGPRLVTHIFSGNVPNPSLVSFVCGMLLKSANVGKPSARDKGFIDIYLESLRAHDRKLASTNLLVSGKQAAIEWSRNSDRVVAYGDDASLGAIRRQIPDRVPFSGYGRRVSFALYAAEALKKNKRLLARMTARDVWMMDQRGCLSPVTVYVESGTKDGALDFAGLLAHELRKKASRSARRVTLERASDTQIQRWRHQARKIAGKDAHFWESPGSWAVVYEEGTDFSLSPGGQIVHVRGFKSLDSVWSALWPFRRHLQCVALEAGTARRRSLAERLSRLGASRVCRAGRMQVPPSTWHHDGLPNLAGWVRWTDLEG